VETLLNIVWLVVCTALICAWHTQWLSQIRRRVRTDAVKQSFIGLICLIALLFPAISLSDDLHQDVLALPDSKSSAVAAFSHSAAHAPSDAPQISAGLPLSRVAHSALSLQSSLALREDRVALSTSTSRSVSDRAPPALV
jgi:hypothetical protein